MNYGNQNDRNREQRGQRDYQRYDAERSGGRRGEESYDERGYERGSYAGRHGFRGQPESGAYDYEREDRFGGRSPRQEYRGGFGAGPEDRGDAREWSSPRYTGGYTSRFSYTPESGRDWHADESGMRGGSYGGGSGTEGGRWSNQGWSSPGSASQGWSGQGWSGQGSYGQGSYGQGGYARYGSGREASRGYAGGYEGESRGGRSEFPESWQGDSSARGSYGRSLSDWSTPGGMSSTEERARHNGKGPKGYRRSDERIKEDVSEALKQDDIVDASEITVQVRDGIVTLTGEVDSRRAKRAAEECAERLSGVDDVTNQLRVSSKREGESSSSSQASSGNSQGASNAAKRSETSSNTTASNTSR